MEINISESGFKQLLEVKLGSQWKRALALFLNYGIPFSFDVTCALIHACDRSQETITEVLGALESHWEDYLQYQCPLKMTGKRLASDPTLQAIQTIYTHILNIK